MPATVLFKRHFQVAYVVDDAAAAIELLSEKYGVAKWDVLEIGQAHGAASPVRFIGNAWVGGTMIEVIEPDESKESIYRNWKKDSGLALRLHHLGFLTDNLEEFEAAKCQLAKNGFPIVVDGSFGAMLDYAYADTTAELGHYYELVRPGADGGKFFGRIPVN